MRAALWGLAGLQLACALSCFAIEARTQPRAVVGEASSRSGAGVEGIVRDGASRPVSLAFVTLVAFGPPARTVAAVTGVDGRFSFENVALQPLVLRVEHEGFQPFEQRIDRPPAGRRVSIEVSLKAVGFREDLEIVGEISTVDSGRPGHRTSFTDPRTLEEVSDLSRDPLGAATWVPGVEAGATGELAGLGRFSLNGMASLRANGARASQSTYLLDGVDNTSVWRGNARLTLRSDFVREIAVTPFGAPAESPQGPGVMVDVMTRSGTKALHGSAWLVGGDERLNANSWVRNRTLHDPALRQGQREAANRPKDERRWLGFTLGGPLRRNGTYFFCGLEKTSDTDAFFDDQSRAPTEGMARGDFSAIPDLILIDPATKKPFPGNVVPAVRLDPVARQLVALIPTVATYGDRHRWSGRDSLSGYDALVRIDHTIARGQTLALSYVGSWGRTPQSDAAGNLNPSWAGYVDRRRSLSVAVRHRWFTASGTSLATALSHGDSLSDRDNESSNNRSLAAMGARWPDAGGDVEWPASPYLPQLTITGGLGGNPGTLEPVSESAWSGTSTLGWRRGKHRLEAGVQVARAMADVSNRRDQTRLSFDGRFTSTTAGSQAASGENQYAYSFADLLLGRASSFGISARLDDSVSQWSYALFLQDEWRLAPRLTLSLGARWSYFGSPRHPDGRLSSWIEGHRSDRYPNLPLHMAVAGDRGVPAGMYRPSWLDLAPRAHAAYALDSGRTAVLRAGAGVYHGDPPLSQKMMLSENEPFGRSLSGSSSPSLVDPWASAFPKGPPLPLELSPSAVSYKPHQRVDLTAVDPGRSPTPWSFQGYLSLEKRLGRGVSGYATFVHSSGHHLVLLLDRNAPPPTNLGSSSLATEIDKRRPFGAPYRQVREISPVEDTRYDAMHLAMNVKAGFVSGRFIYTLQSSKSALGILSGGDTLADARPIGTVYQDLSYFQGEDGSRHVARFSLSGALPRPRGKALRAWLGGWQLAATASIASGRRLTATAGRDLNFDGVAGAGSDRPDQAGPVVYLKGVRNERGDVVWFDRSVFTQVPAPSASRPYPLGSTRVGAVVGPWSWDTNATVAKQISLSRQARLQLRLTVANLFNHANLAAPVVNMSSPDFGLIKTRFGNRRMQAYARVSF